MTTQGILGENVISSIDIKPTVEFKVDELLAPGLEVEKKHGIVVKTVEVVDSIDNAVGRKDDGVRNNAHSANFSISKSSCGKASSKIVSRRNGSSSPARRLPSSILNERRPSLQLPPFESLNHLSLHPRPQSISQIDGPVLSLVDGSVRQAETGNNGVVRNTRRPPSCSWPQHDPQTTTQPTSTFGVAPLLTPPDDADVFKWQTLNTTTIPHTVHSGPSSSRTDPPSNTNPSSSEPSRSRPPELNLPQPGDMSSDPQGPGAWLAQASNQLVSVLVDRSPLRHIQMVVQAIPSLTKPNGDRAVYEHVIETIQTRAREMPDITITHAMPQARTLDEVPASPPVTPNTSHHPSAGYFDDQTVFTHAAKIPVYHSQILQPLPSAQGWNMLVAAPSSVHISTLERYIPPVSEQELHDFFSAGRRSYLADRLLELSVYNGTMLLIFPTNVGATTFTGNYLGPIIEPCVRRFALINNLFTDVASSLAEMRAVPHMYNFEEMRIKLKTVCDELGQRSPLRGIRSVYNVVHSETAQVVLDRDTWIETYLEQEKPRLKQNLVDYHKSGGRMPSREGQIEVTVNMLARELIDGVRCSREPSGGVGIEVALFVIRRSTD